MADARTQLSQAYKKFLGRSASNQELDWRIGQLGVTNLAGQLSDIKNSPEAKKYSSKSKAKKAPPKPTEVQKLTGALNTFDQNYQSPIDIYNKTLNDLGIVDARTNVTSLRKALMDNQALLNQLPANIQQRTSDALVSEAQRQRLVAAEGEPLQQASASIGSNRS